MSDSLHLPGFSRPTWVSDQDDADALCARFGLFHDWLVVEARYSAWVRSDPRGVCLGPSALALRLTDGSREVLLLLSGVLQQGAGHTPDFISRGSVTIRAPDGAVEARFDEMVVRAEGLSWSEGEFSPASRLGPDVPVPNSRVTNSNEDGWVVCPVCSDAWRVAWTSQRCPTCGNVIVVRS
jgi:hypothetical protein